MIPVSSLNLALGLPYQVVSGVASVISVGPTTISVTVVAAAGGFTPYTYQWYRSTTSGFTPDSGNIVSGATELTLNDSGLTENITYYYVNVVTDAQGNTFESNQIFAVPRNRSALSNYISLTTKPGVLSNYVSLTTHLGSLSNYVSLTTVTSGAPEINYKYLIFSNRMRTL